MDERADERAKLAGAGRVGIRAVPVVRLEIEDFGAFQQEAVAAHEPAVAHHEDLHRSIGRALILRQRHIVDILQRGRHDLLLFGDTLRRLQAVAIERGQLELQVLSGAAHLLLELIQHLVAVALQELHQLLDRLAVLLAALRADTRAAA